MPKKAPAYESLTKVASLKVMRKTNAWMAAIELSDGTTCLVNPVLGLQGLTPNESVV